MKSQLLWIPLIFSFLILQACTVVYYEISNPINSESEPPLKEPREIKYTIFIKADPSQATRMPTYNPERLEKDKKEYIEASQETFTQMGYQANYVESGEQADFRIAIIISPYMSALPQEWLTGLSFGIIPSFGTREKEFIFAFNDLTHNRDHTYLIDQKTYNHIILFPASLVSLAALDKKDVYRKALINFLKTS